MDSQRASRVCRNVRRVHSDGPGVLCWASRGSSWKRKMYLLLPRQPQGGRLRCCGLRSAMAESSRGKLYLKLHQRHKDARARPATRQQASRRVCVSEVLPVSIIHIQYSYRYESIVVSGVWGGFLRDPWGPRRVGGGQRGGGLGGKSRAERGLWLLHPQLELVFTHLTTQEGKNTPSAPSRSAPTLQPPPSGGAGQFKVLLSSLSCPGQTEVEAKNQLLGEVNISGCHRLI